MKKRERPITFLEKGTEFEGKLTFYGAMRIDGHFKGEISSDGKLFVGEEGMIEADMHISYIVICGEVHGNIIADQRIEIRAPGKVFGNIHAPSMVIDEGAIFEGNCRMYLANETGERKLAAYSSDKSEIGPLTSTGPLKSHEDRISGANIQFSAIEPGKKNEI